MTAKKIWTGIAGEHYVAAELNVREITTALTMKNTEMVDILASNRNGSVSRSIQVKTTENKTANWTLTSKSEKGASENLFYVFVHLRGECKRPDFYVVPSLVVAEYIAACHRMYMETPKKNGELKKDSTRRGFDASHESEYFEAWSLLGLS